VVGILVGLTVPFLTQAQDLITNFPAFIRDLFRHGPLRSLDQHYHIYQYVKDLQAGDVLRVIGGGSGIVSTLSKGISIAFGAITVLTLMIMLLIEGPSAWRGLVNLFGEDRREWVERLGDRTSKSVGGYVRGNLFISVIAAAGAYIMLLVLDVPYQLPLALLVGLLDIIPLVGAVIGAIICVIVALTVGWVPAVILIGYFIVYQQLENNFIQPVVYSRTVSLTPLMVLLASLIGAVTAGVLGVLVAIPLASAVLIFIDEYRARRNVAGLGMLEPLERVEAGAPDAEEVMVIDAEPPPEEPPASDEELGEATARRVEQEGGEPVAEPGPPKRLQDEAAAEDEEQERTPEDEEREPAA
jgi:predicted PurR-regulated permease PerM